MRAAERACIHKSGLKSGRGIDVTLGDLDGGANVESLLGNNDMASCYASVMSGKDAARPEENENHYCCWNNRRPKWCCT